MSLFAFLGLPGGSEFIILAVIILVLFGSAQLPKLMFNIGRSKQALQKGLRDGMKEAEDEAQEKGKKEEAEAEFK